MIRHQPLPRTSAIVCAAALFFTLSFAYKIPASRAQAQNQDKAAPATESAQQLFRDVVWNEAHAQETDNSYWRYREVRQENDKTEVLDVLGTPHGQIHRLLAVNGVPLSGKARDAEERRIQEQVNHPEQIEQAQKKRSEDGDEELRMLKMLPNAFSFRYDGTKDASTKLAFAPNPNFHPPDREAEVFHHMEGTILVDPRTKRLVEINGVLTSEVKFAAGLLGHLYKGGTFRVRQRDVGQGHWDMTLLDVHMDGKALFFKTIAVRQNESYSHYQRVPANTSLQQAAQLLRSDTSS
jgi:hypothetical protein